MKKCACGLDFGTTNSAISVVINSVPQLIKHKSGATIRSVLFFPDYEETLYIGDEAIREYVSGGMSGRFIQSIKSVLPSSWFTSTMIYGNKYDASDLIALIIGYLKKTADTFLGYETEKAVLGRPVFFSRDPSLDKLAEERLIQAAKKAGFKEVALQLEPIAAAFFYERSLSHPETVLVADLGGGTSDFCIIKLSPSKSHQRDRKADVLGTKGVSIAGDELDAAIMRSRLLTYFGRGTRYESSPGKWMNLPAHVLQDICYWSKIPFLKSNAFLDFLDSVVITADNKLSIRRLKALVEHDLGFYLIAAIEQAKIALSKEEKTVLNFSESIIKISETIGRNEFSQMIEEEVAIIEDCVDQLLIESQVRPSQINSIFMTGGTSLVPSIHAMLNQKFKGSKMIKLADVFGSVSMGLSLQADQFFEK